MSWADDNLLVPGETVIYRSKPKTWPALLNWRTLIPVIGQIRLVLLLISAKDTEHLVTSRRLIGVNGGLFKPEVLEINLAAVENVQASQGASGAFTGQGNISIGSGSGSRDLELMRVQNPMEFRRQALAAVDARQGA